jgi:hypothetical protein
VGIFDRLFVRDATRPTALPPCYLFAKLQASIMDGSDHAIELRLVDGNGTPILDQHAIVPVRFGTVGPGYPLSAMLIVQLGGQSLPTAGDYAWELRTGGVILGNLELIVAPSPAP